LLRSGAAAAAKVRCGREHTHPGKLAQHVGLAWARFVGFPGPMLTGLAVDRTYAIRRRIICLFNESNVVMSHNLLSQISVQGS